MTALLCRLIPLSLSAFTKSHSEATVVTSHTSTPPPTPFTFALDHELAVKNPQQIDSQLVHSDSMSHNRDLPDPQANISHKPNGHKHDSIDNNTQDTGAPPNSSSSSPSTRPHHAIRSSSEQHPSSRTDMSLGTPRQPNPTSNSPPEVPARNPDPKQPLDYYDWAGLEARYLAEMQALSEQEEEIGGEFRDWVKMFEAWASTTLEYEQDRSHKRLRTRMTFVQSREQALEEKRLHYVKVVQAFESALALLGGA